MSKKSEIALSNFFIFNSKFGPKEGEEHKKILFFHPQSVHIDIKIKTVGLCEALVKFTSTFTDKACQSVHTQKLRQLYYEAEPGYWIVLTVCIPHSAKTKEGQTFLEYHEEDVQDSVYEAVLQRCYGMFKLFNGRMESLEKYGVKGLKQRLDHFFTKFLSTLKLGSSDVLDVFNGMRFLPLDKNTYLRIQCFINLLESTFPQCLYSAFLYRDQLVWSGLSPDDMRVLYSYLTTSLFPAYTEQELVGMHEVASAPNLSSLGIHYGKFLLGPPNLNDETTPGSIPRLFIQSDTGLKECHLLAYKALGACVCLVIDGSQPMLFDLFRRLDKFLGPQLSTIASDIGDQYTKRSQIVHENQLRYVYFNLMNLAEKSSIHSELGKPGVSTVPCDVIKLVADLASDMSRFDIVDGETIIKTYNDCWVVSKRTDMREVYIILNQKNANLIEINEEVRKLCSTHFSNIFFMD